MHLKDYQTKVLEQLRTYLGYLNDDFAKYQKVRAIEPDLAKGLDFTKLSWERMRLTRPHKPVVNNLGKYTPSVCLKVPTGGGKTLLACHAIDEIQIRYLQRQTGVVVWIVPSTPIYNQTLKALRDRNHSYRQTLDRVSGGRTMILEKNSRITKQDTQESLVVIVLMLQSSNRENKDTLKMFRMNGAYESFFPAEDDFEKHEKMMEIYPNLDRIGDENDAFDQLITYSFGNMLRVSEPLIIIDEGHKTYSSKARETIKGLNPSFLLELSATPTTESNILVEISGRELEQEAMIKLPIRVENKETQNWKLVVNEAKLKRDRLEQIAKELYQKNGTYIRPIQLIQVERTGKDMRGQGYVHSEDVKEFLIREAGVPETEIAIKSSDKDDIEGINLLSPECIIRYVITKSALQEGWDCSFAYILTVLAVSKSSTAMTQLIGRVLRQPYGQKTEFEGLDECYVVTHRQSTGDLVDSIKKGLENEGLQDIFKSVSINSDNNEKDQKKERIVSRRNLKEFEGTIFLPKFIVKIEEGSEDLNYTRDILSQINWNNLDLSFVSNIHLSSENTRANNISLAFSNQKGEDFIEANPEINQSSENTIEINKVFFARQLLDLIPNPWVAFDLTNRIINNLEVRYAKDIIAMRQIHIINEVKQQLEIQIDIQAQKIFEKMLADDKLRFVLLANKGGFMIPRSIKTSGNYLLNPNGTGLVQKSLFDEIGEDDFNSLERSVAMCFEQQSKLLWWYRNSVGSTSYFVQGWKDKKIYPDFVVAQEPNEPKIPKLYIIETKGLHLQGNNDTIYKQNVFDLCTKIGIKTDWQSLIQDEFNGQEIEFQLLFEDKWEQIFTRNFNN